MTSFSYLKMNPEFTDYYFRLLIKMSRDRDMVSLSIRILEDIKRKLTVISASDHFWEIVLHNITKHIILLTGQDKTPVRSVFSPLKLKFDFDSLEDVVKSDPTSYKEAIEYLHRGFDFEEHLYVEAMKKIESFATQESTNPYDTLHELEANFP